MFSILLKKALPFTLALIAGTALGWLFRPAPPAATVWTWPQQVTPGLGPEGPFGEPRGRGHGHCRMRRQYLVAETRPLVILFKPDARWPRGVDMGKGLNAARVRVTFGADGTVQKVSPSAGWPRGGDDGSDEAKAVWESVERAARQIRFAPETVNSVPVSAEREVEIRFFAD
ncbi:MAG TPA: hypothetical protein VF736_10520 [Pyrinomonadaceae bacterium]|jgi:hypothetical protein